MDQSNRIFLPFTHQNDCLTHTYTHTHTPEQPPTGAMGRAQEEHSFGNPRTRARLVRLPIHPAATGPGIPTSICAFDWYWTFSNVYLSDRRCRILNSRAPRLLRCDSSSSMMSLGTLTFLPRSMPSISGKRHAHARENTRESFGCLPASHTCCLLRAGCGLSHRLCAQPAVG